MGGLLGNTNGSKSLANNFSMDDYYKMCGTEDAASFQRLLDSKIENKNQSNGSMLYDHTKLTFLPNEPRPSITFPPLSLLPTNNEHKLIGVKPMFGNHTDGGIAADEVTPAQITTMEVDEDLLATSEQNIQVETSATDLNAMIDEMANGNYAAKILSIHNNKDKAMFVMQMLLRDAILCGRIDQTMLANEDVVRITQILLGVIEVLLSKNSAYFDTQGFNNQLDLINVDVVEDSSSPYFTLAHNQVPILSLFAVTRNIFNFKMEAVTEEQYRNGSDTNEALKVFKQFFYYVMRENGMQNVDQLLVFRSEKRFRQSTIVQYQSMDPQIRTRNFFIMLDNYLLQLHISGKTDYTENMIFNNIVETDLHRRFNSVVFDFMANINATIERLLAQSPIGARIHRERKSFQYVEIYVVQASIEQNHVECNKLNCSSLHFKLLVSRRVHVENFVSQQRRRCLRWYDNVRCRRPTEWNFAITIDQSVQIKKFHINVRRDCSKW